MSTNIIRSILRFQGIPKGITILSEQFSLWIAASVFKIFSEKACKKFSRPLLLILLPQKCSMTMVNGYKTFTILHPEPSFFSFFSAFQWHTLWFLRHSIAVVDLTRLHGLVLWVYEALSKKYPTPLVQKSLERVRFTVLAKNVRALASCPDNRSFICDLNNSNCYVLRYVWMYCLIYDHLLQIQVSIAYYWMNPKSLSTSTNYLNYLNY